MIIGIMGAMPDEVDQLCAKLEQVTKETYAGVEYHQGMLNGRQVVVCCAGMGKANAASTVQVLITKYGAEKIIFSGIAGNMTSKIGIGDVCVGETVVYHDAQNDMIAQSAPFTAEYHGDPALVKAALDACNACGVKAIAGKIATGDLFVGDAATKKAIEDKCQPDCVEMEGENNPKLVYAIDFDVTPHQLRHTYITNLLYAGVDPKTVQYLAGHENSKTTMDIYAQVKYNKPEQLLSVVNAAFAPSAGA